ncbi:glycosyltransferase [Streptomyces prunicolor]
MFAVALNTHRVSIGLPPVANVRDHVISDRPWLATDPVLGPWWETPDLDVARTGARIPPPPDIHQLPAELEAFLAAAAPPVYVGFDSMRAPKDLAQVVVKAIPARGRRVLLSHGWAGLGPIDEGDDCFLVGEVNQQVLFGRAAAVVHDGGADTTTDATRAGTPQAIVPQMVDEPYRAARVTELGIDTAQRPAPDHRARVGRADDAPGPETLTRARSAAGTIRTDGVTVATTMLTDAAGRAGVSVGLSA